MKRINESRIKIRKRERKRIEKKNRKEAEINKNRGGDLKQIQMRIENR